MIIYYDNRWNANEWFVLATLAIGYTLLFMFPRRFTVQWSTVYLIYGVFAGLFLDHSISVAPVDFYDVNDNSSYEFIDFLTYVMYGPFTYMFAYLHDRLRIKPSGTPLYVLVWSLFSLGVEWIAVQAGVFHYKNGYQICYSFPIYLLMSSLFLIFLLTVRSRRLNPP